MIQLKLFTQDFGYSDYNVIDSDNIIYRICPPINLKKGDLFNVYSTNEKGERGRKTGLIYKGGNLLTELENHKKEIQSKPSFIF